MIIVIVADLLVHLSELLQLLRQLFVVVESPLELRSSLNL